MHRQSSSIHSVVHMHIYGWIRSECMVPYVLPFSRIAKITFRLVAPAMFRMFQRLLDFWRTTPVQQPIGASTCGLSMNHVITRIESDAIICLFFLNKLRNTRKVWILQFYRCRMSHLQTYVNAIERHHVFGSMAILSGSRLYAIHWQHTNAHKEHYIQLATLEWLTIEKFHCEWNMSTKQKNERFPHHAD